MTEHVQELSDHIKTLDNIIAFYQRQTKRLSALVREQADLILWMDDKHEGFYQSSAWLELRQRVTEEDLPILKAQWRELAAATLRRGASGLHDVAPSLGIRATKTELTSIGAMLPTMIGKTDKEPA